MSLKEEVAKGHRASDLLENPIYIEAMESLKLAVHTKWAECPIRDVEGQHELKLMLKLIGDLEGNIKRFVQDGKLAQFTINEDEQGLKSKVKQFFR